MQDIEWFKSINDVPGVSWAPPEDVELDRRWADARPRLRDRWVDWIVDEQEPTMSNVDGTPNSPASLLGPGDPYRQPVEEVVAKTCSALMSPGTRHDYFDVLDRAGGGLGHRAEPNLEALEWADRFDRLAVALVRQDPRAAAVSPLVNIEDDSYLLRRGLHPFHRLVYRSMREGFLVEAAETLDVLADLDELTAIDSSPSWDPRSIQRALSELQT